MKDMNIKKKMIIGFDIPTIFIIVNVLLGISSINNIRNKIVETQQEEITNIRKTMEEIGADEQKAEVLVDAISSLQANTRESIQRLATNSNLFSFAMVAVSVIITIILSTNLIRAINKSVTQLSRAAREIAAGRVWFWLSRRSSGVSPA